MIFNISAFTHQGTKRYHNEDSILVNGHLLTAGEIHLTEEKDCVCLVADGVGGNHGGEYASRFVLEKINMVVDFTSPDSIEYIQKINDELLSSTSKEEKLNSAATTLSGIVLQEKTCILLHAGDSQVWLFRNDMFFQITTDHVLNDLIPNSPITNYFGGNSNNLDLEMTRLGYDITGGNIFLVCTDGLFKSLNQKTVKSIIRSDKNNTLKAKEILEASLQSGAEDNLSAILIQINE